ncbi:MAG: hypothetical protein QMC95_00655 [Desulfitobacteriaceae bacterium]|nr:hypothetical protein [Desulfitobacteriaceae bacterium]
MENNEFQELLEQFGKVLGKLETLDNRMSGVESGLAQVRGEVTDLRGEVTDLRGEVTDLRGDVNDLKGDVGGLKVNQVRMEKELVRVGDEVNSLRGNQARMEYDLGEQIKALFDGYSLRGDPIEALKVHFDTRLDNLSEDVNFLIRKSLRQDEDIKDLRRVR